MTDPITPTRRTTGQTISLGISAEISSSLSRVIRPDLNDNDIRMILPGFYECISDSIEADEELSRPPLADFNEFKENLRKRGEKEFFGTVREAASIEGWSSFLHDRMYFILLTSNALIVFRI
jgi:hypothetical protein